MMIQELRIGNYIQLYRHAEDSYKSIHKIKGFFFEDTLNDYAVELEDGFIVGVKGFRDIPLTEDILLKCAKFYEEDSGLILMGNITELLSYCQMAGYCMTVDLFNTYMSSRMLFITVRIVK